MNRHPRSLAPAILLLTLALSAAFASHARAQEQPDAGTMTTEERAAQRDALYAKATELQQQGDHKAALLELDRCLQFDPGFAPGYFAKAESFRALKEYGRAIQNYTQAQSLGANVFEVFNGRGEALLEQSPPQIDAALQDFNTALDMNRGNPEVLSNVGHIYATYTNNATEAMRYLDEALAQREDPRDFRDRAAAHAQLRDFDAAVTDIQQAIRLEPDNYENYSRLAEIRYVQEEYAPAIEALTDAINAYKPEQRTDPPVFVNGYLRRAEWHLKLASESEEEQERTRQYEAAIGDCNMLIGKFDQDPTYAAYVGMALYERGLAQRLLEQFSDAIDSFTRAIQMASTSQAGVEFLADAYLRRGICWFYQGYNDLARGDFEAAGSSGGGFSDPRVSLWIGYTYHRDGDLRTAIEHYGKAVAKKQDFPLPYVNRGRAYYALGEYKKAIESFNDAVRVEPSNAEHYYHVGLCNVQLGELERARDSFKLALLKENRSPKMYRAMAEVLRELGDEQLAREYEQQAEQTVQ
jgi:tetratricopeptide (TPR) repeat protein